MLKISFSAMRDGTAQTILMGGPASLGVAFYFSFSGVFPESRVHLAFAEHLAQLGLTWIKPYRRHCVVDLDAAKQALPAVQGMEWMRGNATVEPNITPRPNESAIGQRPVTGVVLLLVREEIILSQQSQIFLSHKSTNKPMVRRFYKALKELGFEPWLDEEEGRAGDNIHRLLLQGMKSSCAAVFFITPEFSDEKYLKREIELALTENTERGERFRIVTLRMADESGKQGVVPDILRNYIFTERHDELEALVDILRALPVRVGPIEWRS